MQTASAKYRVIENNILNDHFENSATYCDMETFSNYKIAGINVNSFFIFFCQPQHILGYQFRQPCMTKYNDTLT